MPFGKVIIHSLRRRSGVDVWSCTRMLPTQCVCVCVSETGRRRGEGGVKCYSFSSFHVTEKCLCQILQRRERGCSAPGSDQMINVRMKSEEDIKQALLKVSSPPPPSLSRQPLVFASTSSPLRYNLQPEVAVIFRRRRRRRS